MNTKRSLIVALLVVAVQAILSTGCTNTARGIQADTHNAAEHVENATK